MYKYIYIYIYIYSFDFLCCENENDDIAKICDRMPEQMREGRLLSWCRQCRHHEKRKRHCLALFGIFRGSAFKKSYHFMN